MLRARTHTLAALAAATLCSPAVAAPAPVTGGSLTWTEFNVYETGAPAGTNRTWLGYVTSIGPPFTNGTASATRPATGDTVTPASPRGANAAYPFDYPVAAGGAYDPETGTGELEFAGTVTFSSTAHGFTITLSNPKVVLGAGRAQLFASGSGSSGSGAGSTAGKPYDRSRPVFDLDTTAATTETGPDGTRRITGLAPAIATADMVWPGESYPQGAGPDRTPNTFGTFSLEISTGGSESPAPAPPPPPVEQPPPAAAPPPPARDSGRPRPRATLLVRCRPTRTARGRPRLTCTVRATRAARRVLVLAGRRRLASARVRRGVARLELPRRRRTVRFVALDARGRTIARQRRTIGR